MAEGFEPYHVPQQSRRDKLRIVAQNHTTTEQQLHACSPFYDPSSLFSSSDLLACAAAAAASTNNNNSLSVVSEACKDNTTNPSSICSVKEEGNNSTTVVNLMGFVSSSSSAASHHHHYLDPQSSSHINPTSIQHENNESNNLFVYSSSHGGLQNFKDFDQQQPYGFKPEPLSLSLSSHHQSNLPLELNLQKYGGYMVPAGINSGSASNNEVSRSSVPLGPFTGYASILKGSRFLKPAQQLLEEFCDVGCGVYAEKIGFDECLIDPAIECLSASGIVDDSLGCGGDGGETRRKKSRLISMLDEVYRRYKQYYQQMQAVVASFECVAGLGNAAPYANLALKAMSKHFRSLKNAITDQLQFTSKAHGQLSHGKEEVTRFGNTDRGLYGQRNVQNSGYVEHQPVWRPQRGLPERAVTVLRAWLFEHFLHPYPTDTDKLMLAKQTGLSRSQVSNWFINARVRLWKPMVEEIHMLETRQAQKAVQREERIANRSNDQVPPLNSIMLNNPSASTQRVQDIPSKRTRNELPELPMGSDQPLNLSYDNLSSQPHVGVAVSMAGGSTGVSLTLGLHQNNGMGLSEPFPISAAQRFGLGLEASSEGYVMGGFETPNRHFGRDVIGGQLLHDFVG